MFASLPSDHILAPAGSGSPPQAVDPADPTDPGGGVDSGGSMAAFSDPDLEAAVIETAGRLAALTSRFLDLVAEAERRELHLAWGCRSVAEWLSVRCGICLSAAYEHARVARALLALPLVHAGFARGELSYSKVRAMTRVATSANEELLVEYARYATGAQLEKIVSAFRGAREAADPDLARARHARRYLRYRIDDDGSLVGSFRLPPEAGAVLVSALESARRDLDADSHSHSHRHRHRHPGANTTVECPPAHSDDVPAHSDSSAEECTVESQDSDVPAHSDSSAEECTVESLDADDPAGAQDGDALVHVAATALARLGRTDLAYPRPSVVVHVDSGGAGIAGGPLLDAPTAQRLCCDSTLTTVVHQDGSTFDQGRRRRLVSPAQRRALTARDQGCAFPGCPRRRFLHAHHIVHWADGGRTDLDNLVLLCDYHHRLVHDGSFSVTAAAGHGGSRESVAPSAISFHRPNGERIPSICPPPTLHQPAFPGAPDISSRHDSFSVENEACVPLGAGEPYDLSMAVEALMYFEPVEVRRRRAIHESPTGTTAQAAGGSIFEEDLYRVWDRDFFAA